MMGFMTNPPPAPDDLSEIANTEPDALDAALGEMLDSGFGDLESKRSPPPSSPPASEFGYGF
jgi:hypothetical protein